MPTKRREDPGLARLTKLCLALPEAVRALHGDHADFRVRKKVFAYFLDNPHGDGIISVCVKSSLGENIDRARARPDLYYLPAYIGSRGWFGLRLDKGAIDWTEVRNIVELSYCLAAPKSLAKLVVLQRKDGDRSKKEWHSIGITRVVRRGRLLAADCCGLARRALARDEMGASLET